MKKKPKILYVVQGFHSWRDFEVANASVDFPITVSCYSSIGFLPVYDDLEKLKKDFPDREYTVIQVKSEKK
jgi:hypothetical protein